MVCLQQSKAALPGQRKGNNRKKDPVGRRSTGPGLSQVMQPGLYRIQRLKSSTFIDKRVSCVQPSDQGRIPSNRSVLTPVISVTNSITAYSAMSATRPYEPVLRRNSTMFFLLPA